MNLFPINWIKRIIPTLVLLSLCFNTYAQFANTLVRGTLKNANLVKEIDLFVNSKYLDNSLEVYTSNILEDGSFAFAVEIKEPQLVIFEYSRNKALLYLEPNDTLYIDADGASFQYSLEFSGRSGFNNTLYTQYQKENPTELDQFKLTQYNYGKFWYTNPPSMDKKMLTLEPAAFRRDMLLRKEKAMDMLTFAKEQKGHTMTEDFIEFLKSEVNYNFAYHMLLYGHVFKNKYKIAPEYFEFLDEVKKQNDAIGNYWYREFLKAYVNHRMMEDGIEDNYYPQLIGIAKLDFFGKAFNYYSSEVITWAFKRKEFDKIEQSYFEFTKSNPYYELSEKVLDVYHATKKYAEGTPAPSFNLTAKDGENISLSSLKGKVVFLNFWASWCKPCMKKMEEMQPLMGEMEKDGIVFLNISLDRTDETWENTLSKHNFKGLHVLSNGSAPNDITRSYQVSVLPHYFIINKNGAFAAKPKQYDIQTIKESLNSLNKS